MFCTECGSQMRLTSEPIVEEYKGVRITATDIEHYACNECGNYELAPSAADELSRQLIEGYARKRGLLTPAQIRAARKRLGMTQSEFESALGVSSPTASRWETGAMSPSKSVCKLIELFIENPRLVQSATQAECLSYEPELRDRPLPMEWRVFDGGAPRRSRTRYGIPPSKLFPDSEYHEAKEG